MDDESRSKRRAIVHRARVLGICLIVLAVPTTLLLGNPVPYAVMVTGGLVVWIGTVTYANRRYGPDLPGWLERARSGRR